MTIGKGTKTWHFTHILSDSKIGENCNIGQNVVIGPDVTIGNRCKIQNNAPQLIKIDPFVLMRHDPEDAQLIGWLS